MIKDYINENKLNVEFDIYIPIKLNLYFLEKLKEHFPYACFMILNNPNKNIFNLRHVLKQCGLLNDIDMFDEYNDFEINQTMHYKNAIKMLVKKPYNSYSRFFDLI